MTSSVIPFLNPTQELQQASAITFRKTKNLSNNDGDSTNPQVEATDKKVYVVWQDKSKGNGDILFRRSTDGGKSFDKTINLSNNDGESSEPRIAKFGNNVYVVWRDATTGDGDIYFRRSTNNGDSFGSTKNLSDDDNSSNTPQIAAVGDDVYVVWVDVSSTDPQESRIFFRRSTNEGDSFGSLKKFPPPIDEDVRSLHIAAAGRNVYVAWIGGGEDHADCNFTGQVKFARSTNRGSSFGSVKNIFADLCEARTVDLEAKGSNVYVVWSDLPVENTNEHTSEGDIFYRRSTNNGGSFGGISNLSNNEGDSFNPQLDVTGSNVYASWVDNTPGNNDVFFRRSTNRGDSFRSTKNLSNNDGNSDNPQISSLGTAVRIVWQDDTSGNFDIFFRASGNKGDNFGGIRNLSDNDGNSVNPMIISAEDNIYTVWQDNTPGNFDIFFKKGAD